MAKYSVKSLNYMAVGNNRCLLNMDTELGYDVYHTIHFLCAEYGSRGYTDMETKRAGGELSTLYHDIAVEQAYGSELRPGYIEKIGMADNDIPLSKERKYKEIILKEQLDRAYETDWEHRKYIRLYLSCCTVSAQQALEKFIYDNNGNERSFLLDPFENQKNTVDKTNGHVMDLYDIVDVSMKKLGMHDIDNESIADLDLHHDIYAPQMETKPLGFCQANINTQYQNDAVVATNGTEYSPYMLCGDFSTDLDDYQTTIRYDMQFDSETLKNYSLSDNFTHSSNYGQMERSYILDLPVDSAQLGVGGTAPDISEYDDGVAYYKRLHYAKNTLNSIYSTEMPDSLHFNNCRRYIGIGQSGGQPYLKYYDDTSYSYRDALCSSVKTPSPFQKIEFIYPTDYSSQAARHKSNMFNVDINDTGIESLQEEITNEDGTIRAGSEETSQKLEKLRFDIDNAVREIASNITPANTQLFRVNIKD